LTWILVAAFILVALGAASTGFSALAGRLIERQTPPQGRFLDLDGVRLHLLDQGQGPPVVLIHGLSGQLGNFTYALVRRLSDEFRVVAFDRPGSGYSSRARGESAGMQAQAATLAKAIRRLKLDRPVIVGHSLGGALALELALDAPDCVGALALIAPATHPLSRPPRVFRPLAIRSPALRRAFAWTLATPGGLIARMLVIKEVFAPEAPPADFAELGGGFLAVRPGSVVRASEDIIALEEDLKVLPQRYAAVRAPVGVLYGRDDHVLDWRAHGEAMREKFPSLDFELVDGGHMLLVTQPDVCARFIRRMALARAQAAASAP